MIKDNGNGCYSGTIGKKTALSVGLVIVIIVAVSYIMGTVNAQNTKIALTEQKVVEVKEDIINVKEDIRDDIKEIKESIKGINDKIDDLK